MKYDYGKPVSAAVRLFLEHPELAYISLAMVTGLLVTLIVIIVRNPHLLPWAAGHVKSGDKVTLESIRDDIRGMRKYAEADARRSCVALVYSTKVPLEYKAEAFLLYVSLRGNGNAKVKMLEDIIKEENGARIWRAAYDSYIRKNGFNDDKFFLDTIEWLDRQLH